MFTYDHAFGPDDSLPRTPTSVSRTDLHAHTHTHAHAHAQTHDPFAIRVALLGPADWLRCRRNRRLGAHPRISVVSACDVDEPKAPPWASPVDVALVRLAESPHGRTHGAVALFVENRRPKWIAVSDALDEPFMRGCVESDAWGILHTAAELEQTIEAIRRVHFGKLCYPPEVLDRIVTTKGKMSLRTSAPEQLAILDPTERQLLVLLVSGCTLAGAAKTLGLSATTVSRRKRHMMNKLGANDLASLVRIAINAGLL